MAAFLRVQYHRGVAGIVIVGQMPPEFLADRSLWRPFCIVQCGRYETSLPLHTVRSDINRSARLCWDRLVSAGCRRIGFAFGRHEEIVEDDEARFGAAFALPHLHAAGSVRLPPFDGLFADTAGVFDWFSRHRPDGVVLFHRGQYRELKRRGVRIPGDVSVTVTNVTMPAPGAVSEIAGLYHDPTEIARQCLRLLDVMVRHNERGLPESPRHLLIPPVWVDGASLGGVREKKS
jgi:LacI family transcriptional regulator